MARGKSVNEPAETEQRDPPVIGVTCTRTRSGYTWWLIRQIILRCGGRPVRLFPDIPPPVDEIDGYIFGAGEDVWPLLYNMRLTPTYRVDPAVTELELKLMRIAYMHHQPILCLGRALEVLNIAHDGGLSLIEDHIYTLGENDREMLQRIPVALNKQSKLAQILGVTALKKPSYQIPIAMEIDPPAEGLLIAARDREKRPQALEDSSRNFVIGLHWMPHLERRSSQHDPLFRALIKEAHGSLRPVVMPLGPPPRPLEEEDEVAEIARRQTQKKRPR